MFGRKGGKPKVKASDLTAFIDEGSEIEGKFTFNGTVTKKPVWVTWLKSASVPSSTNSAPYGPLMFDADTQ